MKIHQLVKYFVYIFILSLLLASNTLDIIKLKDGSIIKGKIIENKINEYVMVELEGGSILKFQYSEISAFEFEEKNEDSSYNKSEFQVGFDPSYDYNKVFNPNNNQKFNNSCYFDGLHHGKNHPTTGTFVGGVISGWGFGLIGWGISFAVAANSNPTPSTGLLMDESYSLCKDTFTLGYQEGAISAKKRAIHLGNAIGLLILLATYDANVEY